MSVIINDFEVILEPPSGTGPDRQPEPQAIPGRAPMGPRDVRDVLRRQAMREARVRAH